MASQMHDYDHAIGHLDDALAGEDDAICKITLHSTIAMHKFLRSFERIIHWRKYAQNSISCFDSES